MILNHQPNHTEKSFQIGLGKGLKMYQRIIQSRMKKFQSRKKLLKFLKRLLRGLKRGKLRLMRGQESRDRLMQVSLVVFRKDCRR
jgi:hypothetical protein